MLLTTRLRWIWLYLKHYTTNLKTLNLAYYIRKRIILATKRKKPDGE